MHVISVEYRNCYAAIVLHLKVILKLGAEQLHGSGSSGPSFHAIRQGIDAQFATDLARFRSPAALFGIGKAFD